MNNISILVNNIYFFKTLLENISNKESYMFYIINETRVKNIIPEIKNECEKYNINYKIIDSNSILKLFPYKNEFLLDYTMGMNILNIWYIFKYLNISSCLFIDDDVVIKNNLDNIFISKDNMFLNQSFGLHPNFEKSYSDFQKNLFYEFFKINNVVLDDNSWNKLYKNYFNGGQFYLAKIDINDYKEKLKSFFESKIIYEAWNKRKSHVGYFLDERFINLYFFNELNNSLKNTAKLFLVNPDKHDDKYFELYRNIPIIHICNNSHKYKTYNLLIDKKIIKGEKYDN